MAFVVMLVCLLFPVVSDFVVWLSLFRTLVKVVVKDKNGHYIKATDVIAVIKENVRKFDENKQEFIVIRWFTEKQIAEEDIYGTMSPTGLWYRFMQDGFMCQHKLAICLFSLHR